MRDTALAWLIRNVSRMLPDVDDTWGDAMSAEMRAIPTRGQRIAFTASCLRGLAAIAASRQLRRWRANASTMFVAAGLGIIVATMDLHADSRWPLRIGLLSTCAALGWARPRVAPVAGMLVALGLPLAVTVSGYRGPYEIDRADVWFSLLPGVVIAAFAAALRRKAMSRRAP